MSDQTGHDSLAEDDDPHQALLAKEVLQRIVDELSRYGPGRSVPDLQQRLEVAIAEAGLPEQPPRWVLAAAESASRGEVTVLDSRFHRDD